MRAAYTLLTLTILMACLFSCHKKGNVKVPTVDSPKTSNSIPAQIKTYPYTDTFIGKYYDTVATQWAGSSPGGSLDSPFVFYVVYTSPNQVVFMNDSPILYIGQLFIKDTFAINGYSTYQAAIDLSGHLSNGYYEYTGGVFELITTVTMLRLTFTWSYVQPVGCVDENLHNCIFTGTKIHI